MILIEIAVIVILTFAALKVISRHPILYIIMTLLSGVMIGATIGSDYGATVFGGLVGALVIVLCFYIVVKCGK